MKQNNLRLAIKGYMRQHFKSILLFCVFAFIFGIVFLLIKWRLRSYYTQLYCAFVQALL